MWSNLEKNNKPEDVVAGEQSLTYKHLLNSHTKRLEKIHILKNALFIFKSPINIKVDVTDKVTIDDLLDIDNNVLSTILKIFATLSSEIFFLKNDVKVKLFNSILYYEECDEDVFSEGLIPVKISKFLQILLELSNFVKHCEYLLSEIHCQFVKIFEFQLITADIHFQGIFEYIGDLLYIFVELDKLIISQPILQQHWLKYRGTLSTIKLDPSKYDCNINDIIQLENICNDIESTLLCGKIFEKVLTSDFNGKKEIQSCDDFVNEFKLYLNNSVLLLGQRTYQKSNNLLQIWSRICSTTVFYTYIFGVFDKKLLKQFTDLLEKVNHLPLDGNLVWNPEMFVLHFIGHLIKPNNVRKKEENLDKCTLELMDIAKNFSKTTNNYLQQAMIWFVKSEQIEYIHFDPSKLDYIHDICDFLSEGIQLCTSIKNTIITLMNLHSTLSKPLIKSNVVLICRLIETMKNIGYIYQNNHIVMDKLITDIIQYFEFLCLSIIGQVKISCADDRNFNVKNVDRLSSLEVSEKLLNGPLVKNRQLLIKLALNTAIGLQAFPKTQILTITRNLKRIEFLQSLYDEIKSISEISCMYWHRVVFPLYFKNINNQHNHFNGLSITFDFLKDIYEVTYHSDKTTKQNIYSTFIDEIFGHLNHQILKPISPCIENELRLHVMTHVHCTKTILNQPVDTYMIKLQHLQFLSSFIDTKNRAENYLSETFYDLTAVALHDWHNNGVMRTLAKYKLNLETIDDKLPNHTLEQGLDVLEIMRNLNLFISKYSYNLNNQIFIENYSTSKHLNTINIKHISNSIRIHGTGIMSTTVNTTYQLLCGKLNTLSKYLYDERVKSKLKKEITFLHEIQKTNNMIYPFERAEKLNSSMRKLTLNTNQNYIDQFRILVTHIGNALGYVRMIKSGGLNFCSIATSFIPDLKKVIQFEDICNDSGFTENCLISGHHLDNVMHNICQNIAEGTNYFKLLIDVFIQAMGNSNNSHLHNFYIIIPSLTLNFIEHSINSKEKMYKKSKGAMFTDDGFAVGVAYLLRILGLNNEFDSLKWFQSVSENYEEKLNILKTQEINALKDDTKLQQPLSLSYTRLQVYYKEFMLLYYNINSARIFFQSRNIN
ncbi:WASH complex subunit 4 isoform X2 [Melanaphis sacchari]|uniref:WASH complex subunit 7 n=1 Tax=Melanaphis sacchari TaxID=742174 RepID=A0A2H8TZ91_9HEMI|nr:WASH complex subunit 4 isoform X2 [Melanaphis sacchari]